MFREHVLPKTTVLSGAEQSERGLEWRMQGFATQCLERYTEVTGINYDTIPFADTPGMEDSMFSDSDMQTVGQLSSNSAKVVMKFLWLARISRYDILHTVCMLARCVTKWTVACDKKLKRLVGYLRNTINLTLCGCVGDQCAECYVAAYADASHADDPQDSRSTSGGYIPLVAPQYIFPIECYLQNANSG